MMTKTAKTNNKKYGLFSKQTYARTGTRVISRQFNTRQAARNSKTLNQGILNLRTGEVIR